MSERHTTTILRAIDLFCGAGGLTLGLREAGIETVCAVDFEPYRLATFASHSPNTDIKNADIRTLDFKKYRGCVDLVYGGPPCQPFSSGGLRAAADDERDMLPEYLRVVQEVKPRAFLMENVPGLTVGERSKYLARVLSQFEELGYKVAWKILNAAEFGVPQKRRRLFVVGIRDRKFRFPLPTHGRGRQPFVGVGAVLSRTVVGAPNPSKVIYAKNPDLRPSPYDGHLFNGGGRPIDLTQPCHTILASAGGNKTHFIDADSLVPEYHSHLVRGGKPRKGTLPGGRRLTVEESALIQTFPADLKFNGPRSAQYHQVGDAVPPKLGAILGQSLVMQLQEKVVGTLLDSTHEPIARQQELWG